MDTKRLARGYGALSAAERFPLAVAAAVREDEVELTRLAAATRPVTWVVTDQTGYVTALAEVTTGHWADRLNVAAMFFRLRHLADTAGPHQEKSRAGALLAAYLLRAYADGWALFCRQAGLNPACGDADDGWGATVHGQRA